MIFPPLDEIDIKTDNGSEFSGNLYDADVETSPYYIEDEFNNIEQFKNRKIFTGKYLLINTFGT